MTLLSDKLKLSASVPVILRVNSSSSASDVNTVPTSVSPSFTVMVDAILIVGLSLIPSMTIFTLEDDVLSPCFKVYVKESLPK